MKTKNQSEQDLLDLGVANAANEDGISPAPARDVAAPAQKLAWSPYEVWRTRVKAHSRPRPVDSVPR
ncbi:MAG TPA: hypothetical protein VK624_07330 [Steroidobacteraceae bacterium]|jgi:hypothetical protein|nr:hypothetical protein [Steroidobacteraceae bacterium]